MCSADRESGLNRDPSKSPNGGHPFSDSVKVRFCDSDFLRAIRARGELKRISPGRLAATGGECIDLGE
jgi:hypothetical protein